MREPPHSAQLVAIGSTALSSCDTPGQDVSQLARSCRPAEANRLPNGSITYRISWQATIRTSISNTQLVACVERSSMQLTAIRLLRSSATARVAKDYMVICQQVHCPRRRNSCVTICKLCICRSSISMGSSFS